MTPEDGDWAVAWSHVFLDCLAKGLPVTIEDPVILDRAAAAFRAAEPSAAARRRRTAGPGAPPK